MTGSAGAPPEVGHGAVLARGAFFNALAFLASNLRGIFTFLVARLLGSAVLGTFGLAWAATDSISKLGTCGFDTGAIAAVARLEAAGDTAASRRLMRAALSIGIGVSAVLAVAAAVVTGPIGRRVGARPELVRATSLMLFALPGLALYRISNALSRGKGVMHHDIYSRGFTESLGTALALVIALALGARALAPELAVIAGTLASGCVAFVFASRLFAGAPASPSNRAEITSLLRQSAPIAVYDLLNIGIMQIDVIMLGLYVGRAPDVTLETLGIYAAAVDVAGGLRKVNQAFNPIFAPVVARQLWTGAMREAEASYAHLARWMLAALLPAIAVLALAGGSIMRIYGPSFQRGGSWVAIVAVACALNAYVGLGETILMVERPHFNLLNSGVALTAAIGLNLILIPALGPLGAAIGMLVPYAIQGLLRGIEISWLFDWRWPWRALVKPWSAALLALPLALGVRVMGAGLVIELGSATLYLAGYFVAWRLVGIDADDRAIFTHLMSRRSDAATRAS